MKYFKFPSAGCVRCLVSNMLKHGIAVAVALCAAIEIRAAVVELVDGTKVEGTAKLSADGKLLVSSTNGTAKEIAFDQIRVARFSKAAADAKPLPRGWSVEDIGKVSGSSTDENGVFTLLVDAAEFKDKKWQAVHCAYRVIHGEPVVTARLHEMQGAKPAMGGVMLRDGMESVDAYALLGLTEDKHLRLEVREGGWGERRSQDFGVVPLPIWVKLQRLEKESGLAAFRSSDGSNWTQIAQGKLHCRSSPYPENSETWMPRVYAGLAVSAPTNGVAKLRCDSALISIRGWFGEYFADDSFQQLAFIRPDRRIEFWWGDRPPAPALEADKYSVRWRGRIEPKYSEPYRFYTDKGAQLRINGADAATYGWDDFKKNRGDEEKEVALVAGRTYDVEFRFAKAGRESSAARLGWGSKSQQREYITSSSVGYTFATDTPGETAEQATNVLLNAGVWLRDGTFFAGDILSSDRTSTQFLFGTNKMSVLNNRVARLQLRTWRKPLRLELATNRTGLFLQSGDFMESELDELSAKKVIMSSVLFGQRSYSRDSAHPLAIVMADVTTPVAPLEVALNDGSLLRARSVAGEANSIAIDELLIGKVRVPLTDVKELRRSAASHRAAK
jgi:hypothetical protein